MRCPLFVELCAGTAALSLRLHHPRARPPVSRMGAKTGYADVILRCMGLRPGQGSADGTRYVWCEPDAGVRLLLHAYRDRAVSLAAAEIIRGWATSGESPRALWERLRAEGPARCPPVDPAEAARFLLVEGWTMGKGGRCVAPGACPDGVNPAVSADGLIDRLHNGPKMPATITTDARQVDPREVARCLQIIASNELINVDSQTWQNTGKGGSTFGGAIGYGADRMLRKLEAAPTLPATITDDARAVDPREVARFGLLQGGCYNNYPIDVKHPYPDYNRFPPKGNWPVSIADAMGNTATISATITDDARKVDPPQLLPGVVAYIDPPYVNTTGYAHAFPRCEWLPVVRRWVEAGALVVVSEAEPIPELMAEGWYAVEITGERKGQKRTFSKQQREWLTMSRAPAWKPSEQMGLFHGRS